MPTAEPIKHELVNTDTVFAGTAVEIIQQMRDQAYFERGVPLENYLTHLVALIQSRAGVEITLTRVDFKERAEQFVAELICIGYFKEA